MMGKLAPKSINTYCNMAKAVVESLLDANDEPVHKRTWNNDRIDLPLINKREQRRPTLEADEISSLIAAATAEWEQMLYTLCAASGMRIAEALGLHIDKHISGDGTMIKVRCQVNANGSAEGPAQSTELGDGVVLELSRLLWLFLRGESNRNQAQRKQCGCRRVCQLHG